MQTPKQDGWFFPAEFEQHARTYMIWPTRRDTWREAAGPAQQTFAAVAAAIARFEPVTMLVAPEVLAQARQQLPAAVQVVELATNDAWCRDTGPAFLVNQNGQLRSVNWGFNAWGGTVDGLYTPWNLDDQVASAVAQLEQAPCYQLKDFILEGGSFHVDGDGTAMVTASCLLSAGRNPTLSKTEIEARLKDYLNVTKVLWLPAGIYQDETNGHVDNICNFVRPGEVVLAWPTDEQTPQYQLSQADWTYLHQVTDARGRHLKIHKVLEPTNLRLTAPEAAGIEANTSAKPRLAGDYLGASYINFYFCNGGLILPSFQMPEDQLALAQFKQLFPQRQIIQLPTREILLGGGNIHCITQQVPAHIG